MVLLASAEFTHMSEGELADGGWPPLGVLGRFGSALHVSHPPADWPVDVLMEGRGSRVLFKASVVSHLQTSNWTQMVT